MTLKDIIARRVAVLAERKTSVEAHEAFMRSSAAELEQLRESEALLVGGLDLKKIERARGVLEITGKVSEVQRCGFDRSVDSSHVRSNAIADAKADLAAGGDKIRRGYFGVKNFEAFGDQRCDGEYGYGPRHGYIVFRIGLRDGFRKALCDVPLSADMVNDALYLLSALPKIEELQAAEKVAA